MEDKIIEATPKRPTSNHIIDASLVNIDISAIAMQIKNEKTWNESDRNSITVFKTNGLSIVIIALHKNAEMIKHKTEGLISIQVIEGEINFNTNNETVNLRTGQMLALHTGIIHSITAIVETVFLLTITTSTKQYID